MSSTTKSATEFARAALEAGRGALPDYSHRFSPRVFTQPQLFACLALRQFLRLDYRGTAARLAEWAELRDALGLTRVPTHSTLVRAERRLLKKGLCPGSWTPPSPGAGPPG